VGVYTKFGCYGCGIRGDAIDVIRMKFDLDFYGALEKAQELLKQFEKENFTPGIDNRPVVPPEDMEFFYNELLRDDSDFGPYWRLLNTKVLFHLQMYPHEEWRWAGHKGLLAISMPHYGPDGQLTGVKFRDRKDESKRWGIRGSRYPYLYGSWRAQGAANVVLCEGESDTVNAAFQLRGRVCDVLGLPSGANGPITDEMVAQLAGKTVWILFDGDDRGREAAQKWHALKEFKSKVIDLPDDKDISNCGIPVTKLLGLKER
jgi:DNA primase